MESLDQCRRLEVREKARNIFCDEPTSDHKVLRNLIKQLFHSRLLAMRLVIANSAPRASLAIYHLVSNTRSWNNKTIEFMFVGINIYFGPDLDSF